MRVAYDTGPLGTGHAVRGIGVHTSELVNAIERESRSRKNFEFEAFDFKADNQRLKAKDYGLIHYTSFHPHFFSLPFVKPAKKVVLTVHDLTRLIYPRAYPAGLRGNLKFLIQKLLVKRNIDAIITISETSKKDIVRFLPISADKVFVTYLAPKSIFEKMANGEWQMEIIKRFALPKRFVLYVGDVNYNKNLLVLAKACEIAKFPLVMVGKRTIPEGMDFTHFENGPFGEFLKKYGSSKNVLRLGFIEDEDLVKIWNLATVYCFPSLYEGFSLTPLDSQACGVPVVASKINCHVEILADSVLYADPKSPEDFAEKISILIKDNDLKNKMVEKGLRQVKNYSWEKTARETLGVYEKLLEKV